MNKRLKVVLVSALVVMAGVAIWQLWFAREPTFQGKPVRFWFRQYVLSFSPEREQALETMAEIGGNAVPFLARMLNRNESRLTQAYRSLWAKLRPSVKAWLPAPIEPPRLHTDAATCLSRLGQSFNTAVAPLIEAAKHSHPETKLAAVRALRDIGPQTKEVVAAVAQVAATTDVGIRREAFFALQALSSSTREKSVLQPAIPVLMAGLSDQDGTIRVRAISALKALGPDAKEALPPLQSMLRNLAEDKELAFEAAHALIRIDPSFSESVFPFFLRELGELKDRRLILPLIHALPSFGSAAKSAVPALIQLLGDAEEQVRTEAIGVLGELGELAKDAVPALTEALADKAAPVRLEAATALRRIDPAQAKTVLPALLNVLENNSIFRRLAARELGLMRAEAAPAIPLLREALYDPDPLMRQRAGEALWRIDPGEGPTIVPVFIEILGHRDIASSERLSLVRLLGEMEATAWPAVAVLRDHLKHRDRKTQLAAARSLLKIDRRTTPEAVAFLIQYLERTDYWDRDRAAELLGKLGPAAKAALPALRRAAIGEDESLRAKAIDALKDIGKEKATEAGTR
ncbi:MAG: HEAT repeat domain-containing protein [Verrucomicrobia bacterium]|nr:HEAT repeat domain-containing protein [Verrucomicrobiota bacterium]